MKNSWFTHNILLRELRIKFVCKTLSPLRIGTSKNKSIFSPIDLQVLRINIDGKEVPYIPGSSLKGIFRSTTESIVSSNNLNTCFGGRCSEDIDQEGRKRDKRLQDAIKTGNIDEIINILNEYCLVCKLFGSNTYASHIRFNDAYPNNYSIGVKTGVAINRRSGAVKQRALYTVEFVNPNSEFEGEIVLFNTPNYAIGLVAKIIDYINNGFVKLGGFKTRGFGRVKMDIKEVTGITYEEDTLKDLSIGILSSLDVKDEDLSYKNPMEILDKSKEIWDAYVQKSRSS